MHLCKSLDPEAMCTMTQAVAAASMQRVSQSLLLDCPPPTRALLWRDSIVFFPQISAI